MTWSLIKAAALDALLKWVAGQLWSLAQDMVQLVAQRDDLSGDDKMKLAKTMLMDKLKEMGLTVRTSGINWVLENAVQYFQYKSQK